MIIIVLKSNGDQIDNWPVSPGVYLAIASVVANIVLRYTFNKGVEISWWVAALREDGKTTVADLHHIWSFGTSLRSALLAGRGFNLVALAAVLLALAAVLLALVPANAPLAQRASRTVSRPIASNMNIPIVAALSLNATLRHDWHDYWARSPDHLYNALLRARATESPPVSPDPAQEIALPGDDNMPWYPASGWV
ncbi:hypothetical protein NW765_016832 [Fusarium oxysporum]|nr:hypothetical protein NW765_016832 [Fusarium oxysporum]